MALSVASGSFLTAVTTGNFSVTGVGFQGKVLLLWGGRHGDLLGTHAGAQLFIGAAASSTSRWCFGGVADDNQATSATRRVQLVDKCYREANGAGTTIIDLDFVSFDSDGFTLNAVVADALASRVFYLVLGGADLTNVALGTFDQNVTSATRAVTGVGFQPTLLMLASSEHFRTTPTTEGTVASSMISLGVARSATERWSAAVAAGNGSATPGGVGLFNDDRLLVDLDPLSANPKALTELVSFDSDGFTLNYQASASTAACGYLWLALRGTFQAKLGTFLQPTATGQQGVTGIGFQPAALLFASASRVTSTAFTSTAHQKLMLGAALSSSNRRVSALAGVNAADPSQEDSDALQTRCLLHLTGGTPTVDAEADLVSMDSDGFTVDWLTADATQREAGYLALASAAASPSSQGNLAVLGAG